MTDALTPDPVPEPDRPAGGSGRHIEPLVTAQTGIAPTVPLGVRERTPVDELVDGYLDEYAALDPESATRMGVAGHDTRLTDHSPAGIAARTALHRRVRAEADRLQPVDDVDAVTLDVLRERTGREIALAEAGEPARALDVLASPVQSIREVFDLMPTAGTDDWAVLAERLRAVPDAVASYRSALRESAAAGRVPARRQVLGCAAQCDDNVGPGGFFRALAGRAAAGHGVPETLVSELERLGAGASQAYADLAGHLREELLPVATDTDAVGAERYAPRLAYALGDDVDLRDTYDWGVAEVERLTDEGTTVARALGAGSVAEAAHLLEADASRRVEGAEAFRDWMQTVSDEAVDALAGTHFDVPDEIRRLECRIAPSHTGVVYYTGPSEDLSRPGAMWWSVPKGMTSFSTWQQRTTVYHEGVPGHHLQIAQTVLRAATLNRYRRTGVWVSGHGEGWALYAERLMAELGFLDDPADRLGLVASQLLRSVRVVLDIGVHCGFEAPAAAGGGAWDYEKAWAYLTGHVPEPEATLRFELDRYLGHPGQAPSYKVGERVWLALRDEARARDGESFDLAAWHRRALDLGSVGLGTLRRALTPAAA
ncbi:DUF885 domain-containing protein [Aquipuribacter nitratireducens]|uniref:DUF885 domain-containing protein n=1 Tax=Aquipuribacter nitratireducens TaxID=650104 RepID=A0ABW0GJZ2_9MICO